MTVVVGIVSYKQQYGWEKFFKIKKYRDSLPLCSFLFSPACSSGCSRVLSVAVMLGVDHWGLLR